MIANGAAAVGWAFLCVGLCGFADTPDPETEREVAVMLETAGISALLAVVLVVTGTCVLVTRRVGQRIGVAVAAVLTLAAMAGIVVLFLPGPALTLLGTLSFTAAWSFPFAVSALAFLCARPQSH